MFMFILIYYSPAVPPSSDWLQYLVTMHLQYAMADFGEYEPFDLKNNSSHAVLGFPLLSTFLC